MKKLFYLVLLLTSFNFKAQSPIWVKNNAVWHYEYSSTYGGGFLKIEYIRDTILDLHDSKMFTSKLYHFVYDQNNEIHLLDSNYIDTNYTWNNTDTVFYWIDNHFEILYDFSKTIGDSWLIGTNGLTSNSCSDSSTVQVTDETIINLGGIDHTSFDLYSADSSYLKLRGKYNSRFGAFSSTLSEQSLLFPSPTFCNEIIVDYYLYKFKCFQDDELFYNPSGEDCEALLHVGIKEQLNPNFTLFPNPSKGIFTIESPKSDFRITIYNSVGKLCAEYYENGTRTTIDSKLDKGIYFIGVEIDGGGNGVFQKIIIE